jgi:hypothetical protein
MTKQKYPIPGMFFVDVDHPHYEKRCFFTDKMLDNGTYIDWDSFYDGNNFDERIVVRIATQEDAMYFVMWEGDHIEPIEAYRILKDINELFETSGTQEEFIEAMDALSGSSSSASMQSADNHDDFYNEAHDEFVLLKRTIEEAA